jgi:deoxyribonuclease (pyrimidine dimer)
MTRINLVDPAELTDKHLVAEYRELPRISNLAKALPADKIPADYKLGKGHMYFFYDKGKFLKNRFENKIIPEMKKRGFKTRFTTYRKHPAGLNKDYIPTKEALSLNRQRIADRL